jgi:hypothetical protein
MRLLALMAFGGLLFGDSRCLPCHAEVVKSWANTGMGRSITKPTREATGEQQFRHAGSGTTLGVTWRDGRLLHEVRRTGEREVHAAAWAVGSGNQGKSYLIALGDALFQSPISWYAERRTWDLSPGFEHDARPGFTRPVTSDCLFCHAGETRSIEGTLNRYLDPPFQPASIGCERCHGDPAKHLAAPRKDTIVNAARLEPERRAAVCEQCHLSGEARIPNPRMKFSDFRPGMRMEDVFSVYVKQAVGDPAGLKVVSHSEQMARSRCFSESGGKLWCGSCHDPHRDPADKVNWYAGKCVQCHASKEMIVHREQKGKDCAGCHMPKLRAYDGGHTAFHNHWIRVKTAETKAASSYRLRAWREPKEALRARNLGLALISAGSKNNDSGQLVAGFRLLSPMEDGAVETARGLVLLRMGKVGDAVNAFRRAVEEEPQDSTRRLNLAAALFAAGDRAEAKRNAERAIELEPMLEDAHALLAELGRTQ